MRVIVTAPSISAKITLLSSGVFVPLMRKPGQNRNSAMNFRLWTFVPDQHPERMSPPDLRFALVLSVTVSTAQSVAQWYCQYCWPGQWYIVSTNPSVVHWYCQ